MTQIDLSQVSTRFMFQDRIKFNVSGVKFVTIEGTLKRFPDTLLGSEAKRKYFQDASKGCLMFNKDVTAFETILFYYHSEGILSDPRHTNRTIRR